MNVGATLAVAQHGVADNIDVESRKLVPASFPKVSQSRTPCCRQGCFR